MQDTDGKIVGRYKYDAWGNCTVLTDSSYATVNPFRYRGYYYDTESKLYYLITRYYDPETANFLTRDSIEYIDPTEVGGVDLYAYCLNNPVMYVDPDGYFAISTFLIGLGIAMTTFAVVNTVCQLGSDVINYALTGSWESGWEEYVGAFLGGLTGGAVFYLSHGDLASTFSIMGGAETFFTCCLTNVTGRTDYSLDELMGKTLLSMGVGFLAGKIFGGTKINKITAGRNSFLSVWKTGLTKLFKQEVRRMFPKVITKGLVGLLALRTGAILSGGIFSGLIEWIEYYFGDKNNIRYLI